MSAVDFFANKGNQESVLEEISVFGDAELKAAAEKLAADMAAATKTKREEMIKRSEKYEKEYAQVGEEHGCDG